MRIAFMQSSEFGHVRLARRFYPPPASSSRAAGRVGAPGWGVGASAFSESFVEMLRPPPPTSPPMRKSAWGEGRRSSAFRPSSLLLHQVEIFPLLPFGHLRLEAGDLGLLDGEEIIHE